jgi:hypothetical protein
MSTTRTTRLFIASLLLALFAAACSTGDSDDTQVADGGTTTTAATDDDPPTTTAPDGDPAPTTTVDADAARTASFTGVTEDTIRIGIGHWDTSVFGFGFFGDPNEVVGALTGAINDRGGVNGRMLEPTVASFSPADNEGMLAACITFTEDAEVFAVLGGMRGDANVCVFEQHETILIGSQVGAQGEALERARAPIAGFFAAGTAVEENFIAQLDETGWFDGATRVGIHYDGNVTSDRVSAVADAALADLGLEVAITLNIDDLGLTEDELENRAEIMRQQVRDADIDRMLIFGAAATGYGTYGELDLPLAAPDSANLTTAISTGTDPADLDGTIAAGTRVDLPSDPVDAKTQQCIDDAQAALPDARFEPPGPGVVNTEDDPNHWSYTLIVCRDLDLFVQAATAAGVELTNDSFLAGLDSLTETSFAQIPFASFGPGKYNGNDTLRLVEFDADADEDGEVVPLGAPVDLTP